MPISKEMIITEIRRLASEAGRQPPGQENFAKRTGIKPHVWRGIHWARWSEALNEAGFRPNEFEQGLDEDELLRLLAEATRNQGKFPSDPELQMATKGRPDFPHSKAFARRLGSVPKRIEKLSHWVSNNPAFSDILPLLEARRTSSRLKMEVPKSDTAKPAFLSDSYAPPVIASLPALACQDPKTQSDCAFDGLKVEVEFERRVAIAFTLLGLKVQRLGQGFGRNPDGIAICQSGGWALVYDAKAYRDGFRIGTEDRKFKEYIEASHRKLEADGIKNVYFGVVSSKFLDGSERLALELARQTRAKAVVLIEASALVALVEWRLRLGVLFNFDDLERAISRSIVLKAEAVPTVGDDSF